MVGGSSPCCLDQTNRYLLTAVWVQFVVHVPAKKPTIGREITALGRWRQPRCCRHWCNVSEWGFGRCFGYLKYTHTFVVIGHGGDFGTCVLHTTITALCVFYGTINVGRVPTGRCTKWVPHVALAGANPDFAKQNIGGRNCWSGCWATSGAGRSYVVGGETSGCDGEQCTEGGKFAVGLVGCNCCWHGVAIEGESNGCGGGRGEAPHHGLFGGGRED